MSLRAHLTRPQGVICGVCAEIADRAGIAPWIVRLGTILLTLCHPLAGILLYAVIAIAWRCSGTPETRASRLDGLERDFARAQASFDRRWRG